MSATFVAKSSRLVMAVPRAFSWESAVEGAVHTAPGAAVAIPATGATPGDAVAAAGSAAGAETCSDMSTGKESEMSTQGGKAKGLECSCHKQPSQEYVPYCVSSQGLFIVCPLGKPRKSLLGNPSSGNTLQKGRLKASTQTTEKTLNEEKQNVQEHRVLHRIGSFFFFQIGTFCVKTLSCV